jgi:polysaccharide biosynthesis protein PslG
MLVFGSLRLPKVMVRIRDHAGTFEFHLLIPATTNLQLHHETRVKICIILNKGLEQPNNMTWKSTFPPSNAVSGNAVSRSLNLALATVLITGMVACGGGSSSSNVSTGSGGSSGPACSMPTGSNATAQSSAPTVANGVGQVGVGTFMGMHTGSPANWPSVPFGSLRMWDTGTQWPLINTAQGQYDWSNLDAFVATAQQNSVDMLFDLARTPTWASSNPNDSSCSYDINNEGGPGQCDPPADLNSDGSGADATWIAWVSAIASRNATNYNNQIKYFEIWNEWNISTFWVGTPAQLVRMEQDARCVVEGPPAGMSCNSNSTFPSGTGIDPAAKVVSPAPVGAGYPVQNLNTVATQLGTYFGTQASGDSAMGGQFADVIGFHGYVGAQAGSGVCPIPENVNSVVDALASEVSNAGESGKPWFNTEDGWSQADKEGFTDPDRQTAFLGRYLILQRSLGVQRQYWYRWDSTNQYQGALWTAPSGPVSEAGSAYGEVYDWIVGATLSSACTPNGSVWSCGFSRSGGYQALAVWDSSQDCLNGNCTTSTFTIPSNTNYTLQRDLAGNETSLSGGTVAIGAKPILLETQPLPQQ